MLEATILGAGILGFICVYMFFKLSETTGNEHIVLQLLLLSILIGCVSVIGGATFKSTNCDFVTTNSTINGTVTTYDYDYICQDTPFGISNTFIKLTTWFYRLMITYLLGYFIYKLFLYMGIDMVELFKNKFK